MAYASKAREWYAKELESLRGQGLFKQERFIHAPQGAEIEVEFPAGSPP